MLVTVTLNAAVDKTYLLPRFQLGEVHRARTVQTQAGGKGINVARVAKRLGMEQVIATGFVAGANGRYIRHGCELEGIQPDFMETPGESRTCLAFVDEASGSVTEVLEQGAVVSEEAFEQLKPKLERLARSASCVVLSGSLPGGLPSDTYRTLIQLVRDAGSLPVLDTSGEGLRIGLEGRPYAIKPNREEAEVLLGYRLESDLEKRQAVIDLISMGAEHVLLSLGQEGAWFGSAKEIWSYEAVRLPQAIHTVGCGDSLLAGMVTGRLQGMAWNDAVRLGMACGASNACSIGAGQVELEVVERLRQQVKGTRISHEESCAEERGE
ncbi:1-phosphofructokinase family hexose kinase [Brevibacillus invocatus]|uniref:1-phosphofructokinase family hexose kinase n=1 Tax=Brevibacillus invocatus TaxID=173959 RepID=UPI002040CFC1|nr:1-phosphofructokinase family hexose kinase [Brevibacillus invocatus]MCM3081698.1 1-phosphofructokinase family hexose kinase [Brevibacillus invocatus]MCM3432106.1 1-phosphofructokinase family hexose kinase [Brevibacillus invocatus]